MKHNILRKLNILLLISLVGFCLTACGGDNSGGDSVVGQGTLSTSLTDSSTDEYQAVYVTIARVDVHHDGSDTWETVANPDKTYNLLELVNGVRETLGITPLAAGHYTQMRLIIGETAEEQGLNIFDMRHPYANYIISPDDTSHELKVPSGTNTGLKIVNGFDINENETTELILDFDAMRSVVQAGSSGKYLLKPTVKVLDTANYSLIDGTVLDADAPLVGTALVTAQVTDPGNPEVEEQVVIKAGTLADENDQYTLFLEPGNYNLVAVQADYLPECAAVTLPTDSSTTIDFILMTATTAPGTISGTVVISGSTSDEQYVTIDFRQEVTCENALDATMITIKSINIANSGSYTVELPEGEYQVVASTYDEVTQSFEDVVVEAGTTTSLDITF